MRKHEGHIGNCDAKCAAKDKEGNDRLHLYLPNNVISLNSVEVYAQRSGAAGKAQGNGVFRIFLWHL